MALIVKDRVKETTTTTGTSSFALAGAASGFQTFAAIGDGNTTYYAAVDQTTGDWEVGVGTYSSTGPTLSRDTVFESSNGGSKVNFAAGSKDVFCTYPAERSVYLSAAGLAVDVLDIGTLGTGTANITTANITAGTVSTTPTSGNDLANKTYVDTMVSSGITYHAPVRVESPVNLNATYNNGTAGVGATLTNAGTQAALVIDGITVSVNDRVLVYQQTNQTHNGVYVVTDVGSGSTNWVLTRATDADSYAVKDPNALGEGDAFFVQQGDTGAGETYVCNTVGTITFGTTNITFTQISSAQIYSAGTGLTLTGTQFSITNTGTAGTYGSASSVPVFVTNAQGQVTSVTPTAIAITSAAVSGLAPSATTDTTDATNITSGTLNSARLNGSYTGITGVGTLTAGTWNANTIGATYGGTGQSSYTQGDLLYATSSTTIGKLADVVAGNALISGGVGGDPAWGKIGLQTHVDGTLPVANGGTGATTLTGYVYGNGTGAMTASTTIPNTSISGLGTMSTQDANNVAITGGSIENTVIGNTTPNAATFTTLTATGQTSLGGAAGSESLRVIPAASTAFLSVQGASTTLVAVRGGNDVGANVGIVFVSKGSGSIQFASDNNSSTTQFLISRTAGAVNYVQVTGAATTGTVSVRAEGSDSGINLGLSSKGAGAIRFYTDGLTSEQFRVNRTAGTIVNRMAVTGSTTGNEPVFSVEGTDTNISMAFQSKGTGGISLSTGSTGVNISNGGTVTAITRTATGASTYTSPPTVVIAAPTTAGGVQATATVTVFNSTATILSVGSGYAVNDIITMVGGTTTASNGKYTVTSVNGSGGITGISVQTSAEYITVPSNPVSVTGGTGSGATLTVGYGIGTTFTITNAGSGYVEQPTVTFSGGGGSGAAAYATVGSGTTVRSLGSTMSFVTPGGEQARLFDIANAVNYIQLRGSATGGTGPAIRAAGSDTNVPLILSSQATSQISLFTNNISQEQFRVAHTASAVNYVQVTGAATGGFSNISVQGSDTNTGLILQTKGTGYFAVSTGGASNAQGLRVTTGGASGGNLIQIAGSAAGGTPSISAANGVGGTDTNIDLALTPKGTGLVRFGTYTATGSSTFSIDGYVEIKDAGGTIRKLAVIS